MFHPPFLDRCSSYQGTVKGLTFQRISCWCDWMNSTTFRFLVWKLKTGYIDNLHWINSFFPLSVRSPKITSWKILKIDGSPPIENCAGHK